MKRGQARRRGYTIVEAMVVLVAIGLVLGGVLKGQELINHGKALALAQRTTSLRSAWHIFVDRYGWKPGDYPQASTFISSELGNGDGSSGFESGESALAMSHLAAASLLKCSVCTSTVRGAPAHLNNHPGNQFGGVLSFFSREDTIVYVGTPFDDPTRDAISLGTGIPQTILDELDRKLDDGEPHRGLFRAAGEVMETLGNCVLFYNSENGDFSAVSGTATDIRNSFGGGTSLIWRTPGTQAGSGTFASGAYRDDSCNSAHLL